MIDEFLITLKNLIFSRTSQDSAILLSGTIVSTILNFVLTIVLTRSLNTAEFGLFVTGLTFIQLLSDCFEGGINSAVLNFLPGAESNEKERILKATLFIKLFISVLVALLVFIFAGEISNLVFRSQNIVNIIRSSSLGILFLILIFWGQTVFQAEKKFFESMIANTLINVLRTLAIGVLILLGMKDLNSLFLVAQIVLGGILFYILFKLKTNFWKVLVSREEYKKVLKFGLPIGLGFALAAVYTKLDQILIFNLAGDKEAGIYGLALKLATFFVFAGSSFSSAFIPRFSSLEREEFPKYFKKTVGMSLLLALFPLISIPLAYFVLPFIFGSKFIPSIVPFQILAVGMAVFILTSPFYSAIIYRYKKSNFSLGLGVISLIAIFLMLNAFIPSFKSAGAALAVTLLYLLQFILGFSYYLYLKKST